jgi:Domain of unknown function (DUF4326)
MTTIISLRTKGGKRAPCYDYRIDRKSPFGNPHEIGFCNKCGKVHDRTQVIAEFRKYFYDKIANDAKFKAAVLELKGKILACWCKPLECHGDVIAEYLDNLA